MKWKCGISITVDPDELTDYRFDWSQWLGNSGDAISVSSLAVTPGMSLSMISYTGLDATFFISGGNVGSVYLVTSTITTVQSRQAERSVTVNIKEK